MFVGLFFVFARDFDLVIFDLDIELLRGIFATIKRHLEVIFVIINLEKEKGYKSYFLLKSFTCAVRGLLKPLGIVLRSFPWPFHSITSLPWASRFQVSTWGRE